MLIEVPFYNRLRGLVWDSPLEGVPFWRVVLVEAARIAWVVARDLIEGRLNLRAMSLVYTTLLSIVPVLAIGFAVFRAFGYDAYVESMLAEFLGPLGDQGREITDRMMEFVNRVNANVLGTIGFAFLLYTVISMIGKIEEAFNNIWHVSASRSLARQFTEVLGVGVLGPIVVLTVLGIMAGALSNSPVGVFAELAPIRFAIAQMSRVVPYLVLIGTFGFLYMTIPNTRVRWSSALAGAAVAGIVWGGTGWAFATFVVKSAQYVAIYSAFATLVVFMIWLYVAWLILLVGCSIAFYFQNRRHLSPLAGLGILNIRQLRQTSLQAMLLIHEAYEKGQVCWTDETLAARLHLPMEAMQIIEAALEEAGLITHSADSPGRLLPGKPPELVRLADVLAAMQRRTERGGIDDATLAHEPRVDSYFARLAEAEAKVLDGTTIADLLRAGEAATPAGKSNIAKIGFD
ncbi:MAG: YhjD/YihY/BrkB family envelope integrity protein [Parvibaculum sedimenti]|uniref:YhjD/YihY/BrkB family envelope integrity protein n=1 Tax=Parvibaculum sedimenti TaxID=2608632 RepID=UPI003BB699F9